MVLIRMEQMIWSLWGLRKESQTLLAHYDTLLQSSAPKCSFTGCEFEGLDEV